MNLGPEEKHDLTFDENNKVEKLDPITSITFDKMGDENNSLETLNINTNIIV